MKKILFVLGTRPEAVKLMPLLLEMRQSGKVDALTVTTGQHGKLCREVMDNFGVTAEYVFPRRQSGGLLDFTAETMSRLQGVLKREKPDYVLVQGDTQTALAGAMAAFYTQTPLVHVEAGLRTYDKSAPYPEEANRRCISCLADLHLAPTAKAKSNLVLEGVSRDSIFVTGNTVLDALKYTVKEEFTHPYLTAAGERRLVILTTHRRENIGEPMTAALGEVKRLAEARRDLFVLCPVHENPAVRRQVTEALVGVENIATVPPMEVYVFHNLLARAEFAVSDSGGVQEEADALGIPVLLLRDKTERADALASGCVRIAGSRGERLFCMAEDILFNRDLRKKSKKGYLSVFPSKRITEILLSRG